MDYSCYSSVSKQVDCMEGGRSSGCVKSRSKLKDLETAFSSAYTLFEMHPHFYKIKSYFKLTPTCTLVITKSSTKNSFEFVSRIYRYTSRILLVRHNKNRSLSFVISIHTGKPNNVQVCFVKSFCASCLAKKEITPIRLHVLESI